MLVSQFEGMDIYLVCIEKKYYIKAEHGSYFMLYDKKGNLVNFNASFTRIQQLAVEAWIADREEEIKVNIELLKQNKPVVYISPLNL